jgi:hypothetical protein
MLKEQGKTRHCEKNRRIGQHCCHNTDCKPAGAKTTKTTVYYSLPPKKLEVCLGCPFYLQEKKSRRVGQHKIR